MAQQKQEPLTPDDSESPPPKTAPDSAAEETPAAAPEQPSLAPITHRRLTFSPGVSWDLLIDAGGGFDLRGQVYSNFFGRLRVGVLFLRSPWVFAFGPYVDWGGSAQWATGAQLHIVEAIHGPSLQIGGGYADGRTGVFHTSLNFAIVGVEWQHRFQPGQDVDALFFKLTLPIGVVVAVFKHLED